MYIGKALTEDYGKEKNIKLKILHWIAKKVVFLVLQNNTGREKSHLISYLKCYQGKYFSKE